MASCCRFTRRCLSKRCDACVEYFFSQMTLQQKFTLKMVIAVDVTAQHFREQVKARNEVLDQAADFSTVISRHLNNLLAVMVPKRQPNAPTVAAGSHVAKTCFGDGKHAGQNRTAHP